MEHMAKGTWWSTPEILKISEGSCAGLQTLAMSQAAFSGIQCVQWPRSTRTIGWCCSHKLARFIEHIEPCLLWCVSPLCWRSFLWMFQLANPAWKLCGLWGFFSSGWHSDANSNNSSKGAPKNGPTAELPSFFCPWARPCANQSDCFHGVFLGLWQTHVMVDVVNSLEIQKT